MSVPLFLLIFKKFLSLSLLSVPLFLLFKKSSLSNFFLSFFFLYLLSLSLSLCLFFCLSLSLISPGSAETIARMVFGPVAQPEQLRPKHVSSHNRMKGGGHIRIDLEGFAELTLLGRAKGGRQNVPKRKTSRGWPVGNLFSRPSESCF